MKTGNDVTVFLNSDEIFKKYIPDYQRVEIDFSDDDFPLRAELGKELARLLLDDLKKQLENLRLDTSNN